MDKRLIFLIVFAMMLSTNSCYSPRAIYRACKKCGQQPTFVYVKDSTSVVDSLVKKFAEVISEKDSSMMLFMLNCDSNGNVLMSVIDSLRGYKVATPKVDTFTINNIRYYKAKCNVDSSKVAIEYWEKHRSEFKIKKDSVVVTVPEYRDRPLSWWEQFKIDYGGYAFGLIAAVIGFYLIRFGIKTYLKTQVPFI